MHKGKLPFRIKGAKINPQSLALEIGEEWKEIPWNKIKLFILGIIEQKIGLEDPPKSFVSSFFRGVLLGEKPTEQAKRKSTRVTYLMDIIVEGEDRIFRIESSFFNYRALLEKVNHVSIENFRQMMILLIDNAKDSKLDITVINFLTKKMNSAKIFESIYDYEMDAENVLKTPSQQIPHCELALEKIKEEYNGTETI